MQVTSKRQIDVVNEKCNSRQKLGRLLELVCNEESEDGRLVAHYLLTAKAKRSILIFKKVLNKSFSLFFLFNTVDTLTENKYSM